MTRQQLIALAIALQELRDWLAEDVGDTVEQQTCTYLISVVLDQADRLRAAETR